MPSSLGFEVEGLSADFTVVSLVGEERVSRPFRFDLELTAPSGAVPFRKVIDKPARLTIAGDRSKRLVHGIVGRFEQGASGGGAGIYRATLVPELWRLSLRRDCRIFQGLTVVEIVRQVLASADLPDNAAEFQLSGEYAPIDFMAQYRESDLAFINRITEEHGIWYCFKHGRTRSTVSFGDANDAFPAARPVRLAADSISRFDYAENVTSGKVTLRDFAFTQPGAPLEGSQAGANFAHMERYDYPGGFTDSADGQRRAAQRWQGLESRRRGGRAASNVAAVAAGFRLTLEGHPRRVLNREYLVTEVRHRGGATSYDNEFDSVVTDTPFRPERATPAATAGGAQTATVVGPTGSEIHVDEHGRVKVQFHWDREGGNEAHSSAWIRVCQPWAGAGRGFYFLPRVGDEVLVDFEHGDPSLPIVVGSLYNGANAPPYALPADKTRGGVRTASSPGGGGFNELRFEDKAGAEEVFLRAEKDLTIVAGNVLSTEVGGNQSGSVGGSSTLAVGGDRTTAVSRDAADEVDGAFLLQVGGDRTVTIRGDDAHDVGATYALQARTATVEARDTLTLKTGAATLILKKNGDISIEGKNLSIKGTGDVSIRGRRVVTD